VVSLEGLLDHAGVQVGAHLEHIPADTRVSTDWGGGVHLLGNGSGFGTLHGSDIDGLGIGTVEAEGDGVAVLHEHARAGGDAGVLEVGVGLLGLLGVQFVGVLHVLVNL
jgi:hypothetical protein